MVWDRGTYEPEDSVDVVDALDTGHLAFTLRGEKLKGSWSLVRLRGRHWLLVKRRDRYASTRDITVEAPTSLQTGRTLAGIAADEGGDVSKAASDDPPTRARRGPPGTRAPG
jgi:bifunctional non-homologous end joining protein LigD